VGALVTLGPPGGAPGPDLPWIVSFAPLGDEADWEPVVCGPYERPHALALAEAVVADEELMAVVEPLLPYASLEEIRAEITAAQLTVVTSEYDTGELDEPDEMDEPNEADSEPARGYELPSPAQVRAGFARIAALLTHATPN
jgi:hypothetical protein